MTKAAEEVTILPREIRELKAACASINAHATFKVGDIVVWKEGMQNRKFPQPGEPVVVTEVLDPPVFANEDESGSAYFREPMTLKLGHFDSDRDFIEHHYDGRRFTHWQED